MALRYARWVVLMAVLGPVPCSAALLEAESVSQLPDLELDGVTLAAPSETSPWGDLLTIGPGGGSLRIPLGDVTPPDTGGLRLVLEGAQIDGSGSIWAHLLSRGSVLSEQPVWLGRTRGTTRVLWRLPAGTMPDAIGLRFDGPVTLAVGRLALSAPRHILPPQPRLDRIANGGFELGLTGWCPYGTVAPIIRLTDRQPGSGRWCAEISSRAALLPVVFTSWPLPEVGLPEDVGLITEGTFALEPGQPYTLCLLLRADRDEVGVDLGIYQDTGSEARAHLQVSSQWKPYAVHIQADGTQGALWIRPEKHEKGEGVRLWVDDVSIRPGLVEAAPRTRGSAPDFSLAPTKAGGVYGSSEPLTVVIRAVGYAGGMDLPVTGEVRDGYERVLHQFDLLLPGVPAGQVAERVFSIPVEGQGFFRIVARCSDGTTTSQRELRLARFEAYPWDDSPFGVSRGWDVDNPWVLARSAGACWAREWIGLWDAAESEPGKRSLLTPVSFVERYRNLGYRILACVPFPSASWAAAVDEETWRRDGVLPFVGSRAYLPDQEGAFEAHVASLAQHLGHDVEALELLQEPLVSGWSLPATRYGPEDYVALCRRTREALEQTGWQGLLVGGAGAFPNQHSEATIQSLAHDGAAREFDAWNAHLYLFSLPAEALDEPAHRLRAIMGDVPLWVTELGIWGDDAPSPLAGRRAGALPSEIEAADTLVRAASILLQNGARRIFFAARSLPSHAAGGGRDWLVTPTGQPRKTLPALSALSRLVGPDPSPAGVARIANATVRILATQGGALGIVSPDYGASAAFGHPPAGVQIVDLYGNPLESLPEGDTAFYLRSAELSAEELQQALEAASAGR